MSIATCILTAFLAPIFFLATGAALLPKREASGNDEWTAGLSLLLGVIVYGLLGEFALISDICWQGCFVGLLLIVAALGFFRLAQLGSLLSRCGWFFCFYLVALSAWSTTLFPLPGFWSGDWYENIQLGQGVFNGVMPSDLIGRTPLFGSASLPLVLFADWLGGMSILNCTVTAIAAFLIRGFLLRYFACRRKALWVPLIFCFSGIYLQNAAFAWSKFLASACLIAAAGEILCQSNIRTATFSSSFWMAMAVATHQASVLFVPVILCLWIYTQRPSSVNFWGRRIGVLVVCIGCLAAPYELWTTAKFGWKEKVARNPSVYYRTKSSGGGAGVSGVFKTAGEVLFTTFFPNPAVILNWWTSPEIEKSLRGVVVRVYFSVSEYCTLIGGTLFTAVLPLLCFPSVWKWRIAVFKKGLDRRARAFLFCLTLAVIGNAFLNSYSSPYGSLQTGLTPFGIFVFCAMTFWILHRVEGKEQPLLNAVAFLQTIPWFLFQGGVLAVCAFGHEQGKDFLWMKLWKTNGDFRRTFEQFDGSLGYRLFPFQIAIFIAAIAVMRYMVRRSRITKDSQGMSP